MATIQDVAREAGVSPATVSRVINHPDIVVAEKRERVRAAIDLLGFEPSAPARYLRMGASQSIALLVGDIAQPFHGRLAKAVESAAEELGMDVMLADLDHREDRLVEFLRSARKRGVAGIILSTADDLAEPVLRQTITDVASSGIPIVTTTQGMLVDEVPAVTFAYSRVGAEAVDHLVQQGRSQLALIGGGNASWYSREIEQGVRKAARLHKVSISVVNGGFKHELARSAVARLAARGRLPDGLICANTPIALGALRALHELRVRVPEDASLVVCEEVPDSPHLVPSLTTVGADLELLGRRAVELLVRRINGEGSMGETVLPHRLVVRESSQRPSAHTPVGPGN